MLVAKKPFDKPSRNLQKMNQQAIARSVPTYMLRKVTPMHHAARSGHSNYLSRKVRQLKPMNKYGNIPLHLAAWECHTGTVELLLRE